MIHIRLHKHCTCIGFVVSVDSPLYVYPHSKTVLNRAIEKDSKFLATNFVMDYSLLVGVDEARKELVIGIIGRMFVFLLNVYGHHSPKIIDVFCYELKINLVVVILDYIRTFTWDKKLETLIKARGGNLILSESVVIADFLHCNLHIDMFLAKCACRKTAYSCVPWHLQDPLPGGNGQVLSSCSGPVELPGQRHQLLNRK